MALKTSYTFPDVEQRTRFLNLIAMNLPSPYGYGFGLEFRGLEFSLKSERGSGDLRDHVGRAAGTWTLQGHRTIEIDWQLIANARPNFDGLCEKLWELAKQFGAGR
jgi:hypothetical protein